MPVTILSALEEGKKAYARHQRRKNWYDGAHDEVQAADAIASSLLLRGSTHSYKPKSVAPTQFLSEGPSDVLCGASVCGVNSRDKECATRRSRYSLVGASYSAV